MQQDTLHSSNRFSCVVVVFICLFIATISTEDTSAINFTTVRDPMTSTNEETTIATITESKITSSSPVSAIPTILKDEIALKSTAGTVAPITQEEMISSSTSMTTAQPISHTEEVRVNEKIHLDASENEEKSIMGEVFSTISDIEIISTTEKTSLSTTDTQILNTPKKVKSEDLRVDNCASISDCMKCTRSRHSCRWSIDDNACKSPDITPGNSTNDVYVIENENYTGRVRLKGASFCPRIMRSTNITVPSDIHKMIEIRVSEREDFTLPPFRCRFGNGPGAIITGGTWLMDTISCGNAYFSYSSDEPFVQLPVSISYEERQLLNPNDIKLIIYKCRHMANNCISCLSFGKHYECGWCPGSSTCEIAGQCEETTAENLWIGRRGLCPQLTEKKK
ncbi:plexin A3-like [Diachasmimorpha longicaudata]|uniref:plexin A3-like n=1 Tax=Diachasmimorpha longicaudata TaxID=58733 RepID=UPI0030B8B218